MKEHFETLRDRLRRPLNWFPLPALVTAGLALIICGHLLTQLNPRLGNTFETFTFPAPEAIETPIYISMWPEDNDLVLSVNHGEKMHLPMKEINEESLVAFNDAIKRQVETTSIESLRAGKLDPAINVATIAVDQRLAYYHVRPIVNSLANAGVTEYGFETLVPSEPTATENAP